MPIKSITPTNITDIHGKKTVNTNYEWKCSD